MSALLRSALFAALILGAFIGGYCLKPQPTLPAAVAGAPATPKTPAPTDPGTPRIVEVAFGDPLPTRIQETQPPIPILDLDHPPPPAKAEAIDPTDMVGQMIKKQIGIQTTILDKAEPPLPVLVEARKNELTTILGPGPEVAGNPPPMPRFEPPPPPLPMVPEPPKSGVLVNSRAVALDFTVSKTGTTPVKATELWTTRDGGTTWEQTDRMIGCQSPFRTRLWSEGTYGFRLVFESESGVRSPTPIRGQSPDLFVTLDATPPEVKIHAPDAVPDRPGFVRLRFEMTDAYLDLKSKCLEYSEDGGAWHPIDLTGLREAQRGYEHDWKVPVGVPARVMFRLSVRDLAGNLGTARTEDRVSIDLVAPDGKVTGVHGEGVDAEKGPMPRVVERITVPIQGNIGTLVPAVWNPALPTPNDESPPMTISVGQLQAMLDREYDDRVRNLVRVNSAKEWVEQVTKTVVVEDPPHTLKLRRDPFEMPAFSPTLATAIRKTELENLERRCSVRISSMRVPTTVVRPWNRISDEQRQLARGTDGFAGKLSIVTVLADADWKPTTASPDSYRPWQFTILENGPTPRDVTEPALFSFGTSYVFP